MAADSDVLMVLQQQQFILEPAAATAAAAAGFYLNQTIGEAPSHEMEELERNLFLAEVSEFDIPELEGDDILSSLPPPLGIEVEERKLGPSSSSSSSLHPGASPVAAVAPSRLSSSSSRRYAGAGIPPPPTRTSAVAEELNSLSLEHFISTNAHHKRTSSSPLASPKKRGSELPCSPPQPVQDSKDGILGLQSSSLASSTRVPSLMHRSLSSHALGQLPYAASSSAFDSAMQGLASVPSLSQLLDPSRCVPHSNGSSSSTSSPLNDAKCGSASMRRVCSTGDIQRVSPDSQEECGFKIGKYNLAERKERIHRYRQKRSERNFNKKIKYACRKTLADSRPRVRGRFARNEDVIEPLMSSNIICSTPGPSNSMIFPLNSSSNAGEYDEEVEALVEEEERVLIDSQSSGELSELWVLAPGGGR